MAAPGSVIDAMPMAAGSCKRLMRVRTPAIRCDRPTIQGLPAFSPAQCPRVGGKRILPQRTFPCDANDHARLRKHLRQNIFSKRGVQVELKPLRAFGFAHARFGEPTT